MTDFRITARGPVSLAFRNRSIHSFSEACEYIRALPYKRNSDKEDRLIVLKEGFGTCSTKHAVLYVLAQENNVQELKLIMGIFEMSGDTTPRVRATLNKHGLPCIPEAHMYLMVQHQRIDCTGRHFDAEALVPHLLSETPVTAEQTTGYKEAVHQQVIREWMQQHPEIPLHFEELWAVREQCIRDLFT